MAGVWDFLPLFAVLGNDAERAHHLSYHQALGPAPCQFSLVQFTSDSPRAHHLSYHQALGPHVSLSPPLPPSPQHAPLADESCVSDSISLPPPPVSCVCVCVWLLIFCGLPLLKKKCESSSCAASTNWKKRDSRPKCISTSPLVRVHFFSYIFFP